MTTPVNDGVRFRVTDLDGLRNPWSDSAPGTYIIIGPITRWDGKDMDAFDDQMAFEAALTVPVIHWNHKHGFLNFGRFVARLFKSKARGARHLK